MKELKYTIIKSEKQYEKYCNILEDFVCKREKKLQDEIDLLTLLIEKWDENHNTFQELDPIELLKGLMLENGLKAKDLTEILSLSKGTVSKILNYQKGLSKETIRKLSNRFKLSQEAFNRPYKLANSINSQFQDESVFKEKKKLKESV